MAAMMSALLVAFGLLSFAKALEGVAACNETASKFTTVYASMQTPGAECFASHPAIPPECVGIFDEALLDACGGKLCGLSASQAGALFQGYQLIWAAIDELSSGCQQALALAMLASSSYNATCDDAAEVLIGGVPEWCGPDTVSCLHACETVIDQVHILCQASDLVSPAGDFAVAIGQQVTLLNSDEHLNAECRAYLDACSFGPGCESTAPTPAPTAAPTDDPVAPAPSLMLVGATMADMISADEADFCCTCAWELVAMAVATAAVVGIVES